jgi:subtilisin family serine protease
MHPRSRLLIFAILLSVGTAMLLLSRMAPFVLCNSFNNKSLQQNSDDRDRPFEAWVTFRDKGIGNEAERRRALGELEATFNKRALERRRLRRTRPGLFDEYDLPPAGAYLEGVSATGAVVRVRSRWLNGISVRATREQLERIERLPFVLEVTDVREYLPLDLDQPLPRRHRASPDPIAEPGFYGRSGAQIRQLGLDRLHEAGFTGEGVLIAVLDTGFDTAHEAFTHPDHPLEIVAQYDFMNADGNPTPEPEDTPIQHEHGSLILGAIGAYRPGELVGSAYDASFILCNPEDDATEYFLEERWFTTALEFAEANGADIVTSSLVLYTGYEAEDLDGRTSVMTRGWNLAVGNGVIGFQGGGNAGHDDDPATSTLLPPSDAFDVITVGSVTARGTVAPFTSDGPTADGRLKPEVMALGWNVWTTSPFDRDGYTLSAGSSMATPLLAGAAACLLQARPDWSVGQIRTALFRSGDYYLKHGEPDPLFVRGYGIPDLARAAGLGPGDRR